MILQLNKDNAPDKFAIRVGNENGCEKSKLVQQYLMDELGATWADGVDSGPRPYGGMIYVGLKLDHTYGLTYGSESNYSLDQRRRYPEVQASFETKLVLNGISRSVETVKIGGKHYVESDVIKFLETNYHTFKPVEA